MFHNKWQIIVNLYIFLLNWLIIFEKCERWISRKCIQLVDRKSSTNQIFPFKILRKNEIVWPLKISLANSGLYKYIFLWTFKFEYIKFCSISHKMIKLDFDNILVESRIWRDRNLKFGPNCDLEVDNLEKNYKFG